VNVRRLVRLVAVEVEPVRPDAKHSRHGARTFYFSSALTGRNVRGRSSGLRPSA
jgi:hypothetical protein